MADREKIEGKLEIQKFEYLENEKRFLDEIKSIFQSYLRAVKKLFISGDLNKKERAQALKSFQSEYSVTELFAMSLCIHNLSVYGVGLHLVLYM